MARTADVECVLDIRAELGECPIWSAEENALYWIDIYAGRLNRFDPASEKFERYAFPRSGANVRQILGRHGEVWLPESGTEHLSVIRTA